LESIVGRGSYAHDIAQESFLRLCQAELGEMPAGEVRFWLFRVARNLALNEVSRGRARARVWEQLIGFFSKSQANPEDLLVENERRMMVRELLNRLPEYQRSALLLREEEEMSYREISMVLEVSENKVKIDIFRARQALRHLWFEREENQQRF
jgi:RNA polymerase sigma-70 factor (ECF subfamily)